MKLKSFAICLAAAALAAGLLAGCGGRAADSASSSSEAVPETKSEASTSGLVKLEETTVKISDPAEAFSSSLGWGVGTAGTSLKSVCAAADMLKWAEENSVAVNSGEAEPVLEDWYSSLAEQKQEALAEAWPLIEADADTLLTNKSSMEGRVADAGLDISALPACTLKNWQALRDILDDIIPAPAEQ